MRWKNSLFIEVKARTHLETRDGAIDVSERRIGGVRRYLCRLILLILIQILSDKIPDYILLFHQIIIILHLLYSQNQY